MNCLKDSIALWAALYCLLPASIVTLAVLYIPGSLIVSGKCICLIVNLQLGGYPVLRVDFLVLQQVASSLGFLHPARLGLAAPVSGVVARCRVGVCSNLGHITAGRPAGVCSFSTSNIPGRMAGVWNLLGPGLVTTSLAAFLAFLTSAQDLGSQQIVSPLTFQQNH